MHPPLSRSSVMSQIHITFERRRFSANRSIHHVTFIHNVSACWNLLECICVYSFRQEKRLERIYYLKIQNSVDKSRTTKKMSFSSVTMTTDNLKKNWYNIQGQPSVWRFKVWRDILFYLFIFVTKGMQKTAWIRCRNSENLNLDPIPCSFSFDCRQHFPC